MLIVRNDVSRDSRVRRAAGVLQAMGVRATIVGVGTSDAPEAHDADPVSGARILRLFQSSPLSWRRMKWNGAAPSSGAVACRQPASSLKQRLDIRGRLRRAWRTFDYTFRALVLVIRRRPTLLHCNDLNTIWVGILARRLLGIRVVYDAHELWTDRNGRPESRWWLMLCELIGTRSVNAVITASPGYARVLSARNRIPPPRVVLNVPDWEPPELASPSHPRTIVYVGGVMPGRGLEPVIRALSELADVRLLIVGAGPPGFVARLRGLVKDQQVADRVDFHPPVPPHQLRQVISGNGAGLCLIEPICLSYVLTLPNKLFEYAAVGLPVLASAMPEINRLVAHWDLGEIADPDRVAGVVAAASRLLEPERNAACRRGAVAMSQRVTWQHERRALATVYSDVLCDRS